MLKHYLLERVIRHYVKNVDQVLQQLSISRLLFGSVKLERVHLVPESIQDALFSYVFYACEFTTVIAVDIEVSLDWLSIATRSVQFRIRSLEVELVLHDPEHPEAAQEFWDAQGMRLKAEAEYMRGPAESTTLYKVLGGLDVIANNILVHVRTPGCSEPRMLVSLGSFRYCPASQSGLPTSDLTAAMRPDSRLGEVAYNYWLEMGFMAFSLLPRAGETLVPGAELGLEGFTFSSFGKVPANGRREAPFYATTVNALEVRFLRAGAASGPLPLEVLLPLAELLSRAWVSDDLRDGRRQGGEADELPPEVTPQASEQTGLLAPERKNAEGAVMPQTEEARLHVRERLLAAQQTRSDIADLLAGCSRTSKGTAEAALAAETGGAPWGAGAPGGAGTGAPTVEDGDDFKDCEDVGDEVIDPGELPGSCNVHPARLRECFRQGPLKRFMFAIGGCCLQVAGKNGAVVVEFADFRASTDKRREFSPQEVECLRALFGLPVPATSSPTNGGERAGDPAPGMIYAGLSLASAQVSFTAAGKAEPGDVLCLRRGLKLWHRGSADVLLLPSGPVQIMEVEVAGVVVRDHGREALTAMWEALVAALAPSPGPVPPDGPRPLVGYSLEALDVCLEAGSPPVRCSLPCMRLSSVFGSLADLWSYADWWGPRVTRGPADPIGSTAVEPAARPWWEPPRRALRVEPPPERRGGGAGDVVADLELRLAEERRALGAERARTTELEAQLRELLRLLRSWPEGPLPLALQTLLAEAPARDSSGQLDATDDVEPSELRGRVPAIGAPDSPASRDPLSGMQLVTYDLDFGKAVLHSVEGLRRGDAVQWFLEEVQDRAVDVRAVLRSRRKLHAARCLRESMHTSRRRDFFEVTDDFGEEQLPLTLEIHLSNASWFSERRVRLKLCRVQAGTLPGSVPPWPALGTCPEEEE